MPVLSWGHSAYWQTQAPEQPVTGASASGGYIPYMPNVTITFSGSLFGGLQPMWEWTVTKCEQRADRR